jgi:hypothetical protein
LSTLSVWSPPWNYCCVCSHHLRWWLLLLSGDEYMYYLNSCLPTQCRNPFSGIKIGNLTFWIALVPNIYITSNPPILCLFYSSFICDQHMLIFCKAII